ncbi:MAG: CDP-alcohol phosphatidyltransferase family protein [Bacteroidales bacterium]|nr:CDP-alcohol phosphatidyltransferase family protein [Bacteroidales bacterium]
MKKYIPDAITCMNLLCGVLGIIAAFHGFYLQAFVLMLLASVFDFCDGLAARALDAYSDLGKELDSLSDMVSFGVLPAVMLFNWVMGAHGGITCVTTSVWVKLICCIPLLIAAFSGLRLAKFNVDERQTSSFIGLPTPACAMICGSLVACVSQTPDSLLTAWCNGLVFIPVLSLVLSFLLVCELPMFSLKFHKGDDLKSPVFIKRYILLACLVLSAIAIPLAGLHWTLIITSTFISFIVINLVCAAMGK